MAIRKGTFIKWKKGGNFNFGKVEKSYSGKVTLHIMGVPVTRHGSKENRVLLIRDETGSQELKLLSEVERISSPPNEPHIDNRF